MPELVKTWNQLVADAYEATTGEKVSESDFEHITAPRGMGRHLAKSADQEQWIIDRIIARNITLADLSYELATSEG